MNRIIISLFAISTTALAQSAAATSSAALVAPTTLPVVFTKTISADHSHIGDAVEAKTSQSISLADGTIIPSGARIIGHVVAANRFTFDKTPYAVQKASTLSIRFDSVQIAGSSLPLNVTVRAMADPLTSWGAREPKSTDLDTLSTVTQVGGDQLTPSQSEVVNMDGDVVAYNKRGGVYAHLVPSGHCDGSSVEVSVGIYSASACGLYGFTNVSAEETGSARNPSTLSLVSSRVSPKVWKNSTALLEVLPDQTVAAVKQ